ncbi:MAG TPA: flagellar hook capping FlgD N-terminal domain-containing protein [Gemmataceae bacterium]|nr:flagellar hook capping FlgD N-terminal domain-containing protein [Gemmataceae bacterium]
MSSLSSVGGATNPTGAASGGATNPTGAASSSSSSSLINQQQFLQLLTAQLQNQDPMDPVSATDFTSQLAELSTVSGIQQLATTLQQMLQLQQLGQGAGLIGQTVSYVASGSTPAGQGVVQAVNVQNGQLQVQVGNQQVPIGQVTGVVQS